MAGVELATAYISIIPEVKGMNKAARKSVAGLSADIDQGLAAPMEDVGEKRGKSLGGKLAAGVGMASKAGFAAAGAVAATALAKGFGRLKSLDEAEGKLKGLGHSTKSVEGIMDNALASVKGTAFGMDEAATTAAGAVAAGIKPGKDLEGNLKLVADAATIAGTDMGSMGAIFNKVASQNKVQGDVLAQLGDQGIPIVQFLAKEMGKSAEEVTALASKGEIDFETFSSAMEKGLGGAAAESGSTFSGAMKNAGAALGRLGASVLSGVFPQLKGGFGAITQALDSMGPAAEKVGAKFGAGVKVAASGIGSFIADFRAGEGAAGRFRDVLSSAFQALLPHLQTFASSMAALWPQVKELGKAFGGYLVALFKAAQPYLQAAAAVIGVVLVGAMKALPPILSVVLSALTWQYKLMQKLAPVIAAIGAALLTKFVAGLIASGVQWAIGAAKAALFNVQMAIFIARTYAAAAAQKIAAVATKAWAIAQRLMNAAMNANPIGLLITGLLLLGAGLVLAYKKSETFRRIVNAAWAGIKAAASATVGWFTNTAWPNLKAVFSAIGGAAKGLWTNYMAPAFKGIGTVVKWLYGSVIKPYFGFMTKVIRTVGAVVRWLSIAVFAVVVVAIAAAVKWLWGKLKGTFNLIRAGVKLVGAGFKALYTSFVKPAFNWIAKGASWLWGKLRTAFNYIKAGAKLVGAAFKAMYTKYIKPAFNWIAKGVLWLWVKIKIQFNRIKAGAKLVGVRFKELYNKYIKPVTKWFADRVAWLWGKVRAAFNKIKGGATSVGNGFKALYTKGIKPATKWIADRAKWLWGKVKDAFDKIKGGARGVRDSFSTMRKGIKKTWDKLYGNIKSPIRKALTWLNDTFVTKINNMLGNIPGVKKSFRIPKIKGFDTGGYTGRGGKYVPAGIVHKDEFVLKKEATNKLRRQIGLDGLNYMNRTGMMPHGGYAKGGIVALGKKIQKKGYHVSEHPAFGGVARGAHSPTGYHYKGGALDINADPWLTKFKSEAPALDKLNRWLKGLGWNTIWRAPNHYDHLHVDIAKGGKGGGGGFGLPDWAANPLKWVKGKFKNFTKGFTDGGPEKYGLASKVLPPVFTNVRDAVVKKVKDAAELLDFGGDSMDFSGIAKGANVVMGKAMAERYGWTGRNWTSLKALWQGESGWNHRAKNPSSGAYGIPQSLPASKMASAGSDWRTNAKTQIAWGLRYIKERYGSPSNAYSKWRSRSPHWYADGGLVGPALEFDRGGYLPVGRTIVENNTGKPEPLKRMDIADGSSGAVKVYVQNPWTGEYHEARMQQIVEDHSDFEKSVQRMRR